MAKQIQDWELVYNPADTFLPDSASITASKRWVKDQVNGSGSPSVAIESDSASPTGSRLNIHTGNAGETDRLFYYQDASGKIWFDFVNNARGYTIEASVKVIDSDSGGGQRISCQDGTYTWELEFNSGSLRLPASFISESDQTYSMSWSVYHTIRIAVKGTLIQVYVDGVLRITGTLDSASATKKISFGDVSASTTLGGQVYWGYFDYTTKGVFRFNFGNPNGDVWNVAYDADVLPENSQNKYPWEYTSSGSPTAPATQSDSGALTEGKSLRIDTSGGATTQRSSYGHDASPSTPFASASNATGYTIEYRCKQVSGGSGVMSSQVQISDDIYSWSIRHTTDKIILNAVDIAEENSLVIDVDFTKYQKIRVSVLGTRIKVYVNDELKGIGTLDRANAGNTIQFGDIDTSGGDDGTSDWDFFRYSIAGAYAPKWDVEYIGDVVPASHAPSADGFDAFSIQGTAPSAPTQEILTGSSYASTKPWDSTSRKILHTKTEVATYTDRLYYSEKSTSPWVTKLLFSTKYTIEVRLKVLSGGSGHAGRLQVADNVWQWILDWLNTGVQLQSAFHTSDTQVITVPNSGGAWTDFNTFRFVVDGTNLKCYRNNIYEFSVTLDLAQVSRYLDWGDIFGIADYGGEFYWDWLYYNTEQLDAPIGYYDSIAITENVSLVVTPLIVSVYEFSGLLITEHVDVIDLVVEVGVVDDFVNVLENTQLSLDVLNIDVNDNVSVVEDVQLQISIDVSVFDSITITEFPNVEAPHFIVDLNVFDSSTPYDDQDDVVDSISYTEFVVMTPIIVQTDLSVYDEIGVIENVTLDLQITIDVFEGISATENVSIEISTTVNVADEITTIEQVTVFLDVLNFSIYDDLTITESVSVIDLVVELGIVNDDITATENVNISLDVLNISVNDLISITENVSLYLDVLYLSADDLVSATENVVLNIGALNIDVFDSATITEDVSLYLDVLNISVFDTITITEFVTLIDLVIDVGVVNDDIATIEDVVLSVDVLYVSVNDTATITENVNISLDVLFIFVNDNITTIEDVTVLDIVIELEAYDEITTTEAVTLYLNVLNISVFDTATITEDISLYLDVLNIDVLDPFHVMITEHIDVVDLVVEVGVVAESINPIEFVSLSLDSLYLSVYDESTIAEYVELLDIVIDIENAFDNISITENVSISLDVLNISIYEDILATEDIQIYLDSLNIAIYDDITITESVSLHDIVIELGIVYDDISVVEDVSLSLNQNNISVYDEIATTENTTLSLDVLNIDIFDSITATEDVFLYFDTLLIIVNTDILVTESVSVIDLVIELGVVNDDISAVEDVSLFLDQLFISVNDNISISEYVEVVDIVVEIDTVFDTISVIEQVSISLDILNLSVFDNISIVEYVEVFDPVIELGIVYDDISIIETVNMNDAIYSVTVEENISIIESVNLYLDILNLSIYDDISIAEYVQLLDIEIDLPVIYDDVVAVEDVSLSLDQSYIDVFDAISIEENVNVHDEVIDIGVVFDDISVVEFINVNDIIVELGIVYDDISAIEDVVIYIDVLNISESDTITITEFVDILDLEIDIANAYDDIAISDVLENIYLDNLNIEVLDPFHVLITEHIDVVDLTVEVGVVEESITITDAREVYLDSLYLSIFNEIAITEYQLTLIDTLVIDIYDDIAILEYVEIVDLAMDTGIVYDDISIVEFVNFEIVSGINIYDDITILEYVEVLDIEIDIEIYDDINIVEYIDVFSTEIAINVFDNLVTSEDILNYMPISLYVAEQKGISIITVSNF